MAFDSALLADDIADLARNNDFEGLATAVASFATLIGEAEAALPVADVERALKALRGKRQFAAMIRLAEAAEANGLASNTVRRFHAQAMIDSIVKGDPRGRYEAADAVLRRIIETTASGEGENKEAWGLIGRTWKQFYVDTALTPPTAEAREALQRAIGSYGQVVKLGNFAADHWPFVNFVALTARAERDGVDPNHSLSSVALAKELIAALSEPVKTPNPDLTWQMASLAEAHVAIGDYATAKTLYARYIELAGTDAFEVMSSLRQLVEVWQLSEGPPPAREIIAMLEARAATLLAQQQALSAPDLARIERLEAAMSRGRPGPADPRRHTTDASGPLLQLTLSSQLRMVRRGICVARIKDRIQGSHVGTGFLLRGQTLSPALGDDVYLLTNSHVVGREPGAAYRPAQIEIALTDRDEQVTNLRVRDADIVWESRRDRLDATLLRLAKVPEQFGTLTIVAEDEWPDDFADLDEDERQCFVAGHLGPDLQLWLGPVAFKIHDLGWRNSAEKDMIYLHHDVPTRDGSSGSPLFSLGWEVIALHRGASADNELLPALGGRLGDRAAKVAVSINAIRRAVARDLAGGHDRAASPTLLSEKEAIALLQSPQATEDELAELVEVDEAQSEPFKPVFKRQAAADGTNAEGAMGDLWEDFKAKGFSAGFQARRNYRFRKGDGLTFVSDGDSWFQYPMPGVTDTIDHLSRTHAIYCHAIAGSQLKDNAAQVYDRIIPSIRDHHPDGILLSGGGNDILGFQGLQLLVDSYHDGADAHALMRPGLDAELKRIAGIFSVWIERILSEDKALRIFCHGYDWALPKAPGGRWLYRPLSQLRIADPALQRQIVRLIIDGFNTHMRGLEQKFPGNVFFVDCRGAVGPTSVSWYDELHPLSAGFGRVAQRFNRRIAEAFEGDARVRRLS